MKKFSTEKLILDLLKENVTAEGEDFKFLEDMSKAFEKVENFYTNLDKMMR